MSIPFVHLRLHTEYSIEDSIIQINDLVKAAQSLQLPALALTDRMNLFAGIKFYKKMSQAGIKPILGVDAWLENDVRPAEPIRCTILCHTNEGYHHLLDLISLAYQTRVGHQPPLLKKHWFQDKGEGLIVLSGGLLGDIGQALVGGRQREAMNCLKTWQALFPKRFYIELQRIGHPQEENYIKLVCELAETYQVPVVATHDVRFLSRDDFEAHEARVCIQNGYTLSDARRPKLYTAEQYLKDAKAMQMLFSDIPSALTNSVEIAKRCNVTLDIDSVHLPHFPVPKDLSVNEHLIQEAKNGLKERLAELYPTTDKALLEKENLLTRYQSRLQTELDVINNMGFASYFLIVADFIRWAKRENIPVGPGRGSGAGSLVAYSLKITDVDPLHYGLLFERFLNADRVSLPDFDIDFCMERRDQVIEYVVNRYGCHAVAQIITFGTMAARAVIRDVGRALGYPYGMVDAIAKLVPFEVGITLERALQRDQNSPQSLKGRYDREEEIKLLIDLAMKLEGLVRNVGTHAGGVVIAPNHLTEFTALYYESENTHAITQLDKDDLETAGLVKFDFLGLRTLTIIDWTVKMVNQQRLKQQKPLLDINHLPLDDQKTFALLQSAKATGVFQLESRGIRALLKRLAPDHFEDIVALIALFRPGPLQSGMVDDFIERKHDASKIRYLHPLLEPILSPTYGVILYQEQVMQIAQVLAGYSLGSADLLRRAMGKKKPEEMAKQRAVFIQGSDKKGIDKMLANTMFDLIEKFAGYGFNKSHSVAYALISYQTAWLKAHYPTEFMAAVLSSEIENTERLSDLIYECYALGLTVKAPSIHTSQYAFTVNETGEIEYGLGAIKGMGHSAVTQLLNAQQTHGQFNHLFELCRHVGTEKLNRRALEALIYSGSLDVFQNSRAKLHSELELAMQAASHHANQLLLKQADLFGEVSPATAMASPKTTYIEWNRNDKLKKEKAVLGLYLSDHPINGYQDELKTLHCVPLKDVYRTTKTNFLCQMWLVDVRIKFTPKGDRFAILLCEDVCSRIELKLSQIQYQTYREYLVKDTLIILDIDRYMDKVKQEPRLVVKQLWSTSTMRLQWGKCLKLIVYSKQLDTHQTLVKDLQNTLQSSQGNFKVIVEYHTDTAVVPLLFGEPWQVEPTDQLLNILREQLGVENVWVVYQ